VLIIMVGHLSVNQAVRPLAYVLTSYNKVKLQGIVTIGLGVANLCLAVILARWSALGAVGVAVAGAIVLTAKNLGFVSGYSAHVMGLRWWSLSPALLAGPVNAIVVALGAYGLTQILWPVNWFALGAMAIVVSLMYSLAAFYLCLNQEDRLFLMDLFPSPVKKHFS
jgi:hypothetical protein